MFISSEALPPTPEALMRSRYTAYTQANISYIMKTMKKKAAKNFDAQKAFAWAKNSKWLGLVVMKTFMDPENPKRGFVEFIAGYELDNKKQSLHEISEFHLEKDAWYYVDGIHDSSGARG
jgi:SEC-C motif-containing protein